MDLPLKATVNEVFAVRDGETTRLTDQRPVEGRWLALMLRSVTMPDGPREPVRQTDGMPVEDAAVVAAQVNRGGLWQWVALSPATKEFLGDLLIDSGADREQWYYATFSG